MKINEKIRIMHELNGWRKEDMADKLHMSLKSFAKLKHGKSKIYIEKLEQVADVFNIDLMDLVLLNNSNLG